LGFEGLESRSLLAGNLFHFNPIFPEDTTVDGQVTPLDALVIINGLNAKTASGESSVSVRAGYDVDGDGRDLPLDALIVINHLNSQRAGSSIAAEKRIEVLRRLASENSLPRFIHPTRVDQVIEQLASGELPELRLSAPEQLARLARPQAEPASEQISDWVERIRSTVEDSVSPAEIIRTIHENLTEHGVNLPILDQVFGTLVDRFEDSFPNTASGVVDLVEQTLAGQPLDLSDLADDLQDVREKLGETAQAVLSDLDRVLERVGASGSIEEAFDVVREELEARRADADQLAAMLIDLAVQSLDRIETHVLEIENTSLLQFPRLLSLSERLREDLERWEDRLELWTDLVPGFDGAEIVQKFTNQFRNSRLAQSTNIGRWWRLLVG
jgi:hypothetical protein